MVAQRGRGVEAMPAPAPAAAAPRPAAAPAATPQPQKRRLSGRQQHALATLPDRMAALGRETGQLRQALSDPTLYARDRGRFERFTAALTAKEAELAAAEEEWLELELLREEGD